MFLRPDSNSPCAFRFMSLRKYESLPQKEREALERAFFQYDADLSGFLEWDEVIPALRAV